MPDSLRFELTAPAEARLGAAVPITLRLTNVTDHPVEAHFLGREIAFDIVVTGEDGAVAWQRLGGKVTQGILQIRTLPPRETIEFRDTWRPLKPGGYVIRAELPSDDPAPRRTQEARIRID